VSEAAFEVLGIQHRRKIKGLKIWSEELKPTAEQRKDTYHKWLGKKNHDTQIDYEAKRAIVLKLSRKAKEKVGNNL
jgi:hypothetical protein